MTRKRIWLCSLATMIAVAAATGRVWSQDGDKEKKDDAAAMGGMPDMAEMMKKYEMAAKPGPHHKLLERSAGEWTTKSKMWMDPSAPPTETTGKSTCRLVLGGRFVQEEFDGDVIMPNAKGEMVKQAFKGMGLTGYDNVKNLYVATWADDMNTGILSMSGSYNPMTKTLQMFGQMDDVGMGIHGKTIRYESKIVSNDKHIFTMYDCHAGVDYKVMEITYTRAK
jgi:Protein of unknown function (DUF1579)